MCVRVGKLNSCVVPDLGLLGDKLIKVSLRVCKTLGNLLEALQKV